MENLDKNELALWIQFLRELTGISLNEQKDYLIRERFQGLLEKYQCSSFSHLYFMAREKGRNDLREDLIDQITTKETSFFRDSMPFEALRRVIFPELLERRRHGDQARPLMIWSAACSTGQEVYSIAMILQEMGVSPSEYRILGTDISRRAIEASKAGIYSKFEVDRGMSPELLKRFFIPVADRWQARDLLKESITFQRLNLCQSFVLPDSFDLIICRNVAIYFSEEEREKLFHKINRQLYSHGYLLIGATETVRSMSQVFHATHVGPNTVFLKPAI